MTVNLHLVRTKIIAGSMLLSACLMTGCDDIAAQEGSYNDTETNGVPQTLELYDPTQNYDDAVGGEAEGSELDANSSFYSASNLDAQQPAPVPLAANNDQPMPSGRYFRNCAAARAAGAAPVYRGDPGYASHLDRDNDGIGCEWH